jgi:hypothetical protein
MRCLLGLSVWVAVSVGVCRAEVTPATLFSDPAVLLSGARVPIWGTAFAAEKVTVSVAEVHASVVTGADGAPSKAKGWWAV